MGSGSSRLAPITGPAKDNGKGASGPTRMVSHPPDQQSFSDHPPTCRTRQGPQGRPAAGDVSPDRPRQRTQIMRAIKPIERLVPVSSTRHRAYTPGLSTWSSSTALIGSTRFEVGFPLRCLQRLSRPYIATLHCGWRHNSSTRGTSIPVLSY
jgi:hypothetical protein